MLPTDMLREDHDLIFLVLRAMKAEVHNFESTGKINLDKIEKFLDFTENFSDGYHHIKENKLFRLLEENGMSKDSSSISELYKEHTHDKVFTMSISKNIEAAKQGDSESLKEIKENLSAYIEMVKNHIYTENNIIFNNAERMLNRVAMDILEIEYHQFDKQKPIEKLRKKYRNLAFNIAGMNNEGMHSIPLVIV